MIAELPDGRRLEFPDGTDPAVVQQTVKKVLGVAASASQAPSAQPAPKRNPDLDQPLTFAERHIAPMLPESLGNLAGGNVRGSAVGRAAMGAADPGVGLFQLGANAIGKGDAVNQRIHDVEGQYQAARGQAGSTGFDPLRLAGNFGITVPAAAVSAPVSMMARLLQGGGIGAGFGAAQPVTNAQPGGPESYWPEKGKQSAIAGGAGVLGVPVSSALARLLQPKTGEAAKSLMKEGITLTPGQTLGGGFQRAEDAATSIPVLGDFIRDAKNRTLTDFNRAAYARALKPIGEDASKLPVGPEGIKAVKTKLGDAYDALLPKLSFDVKTVVPELSALRKMAKGMPAKEAEQFKKILDKNLGQLSVGKADGQTFKTIESNLGAEAKAFRGATDGYQKQLGDALAEAQRIFREGLTKSNPAQAGELAKINEGYANYARIRAAGASAGDKSNGFTPAQLAAAIRNMDKSAGKGATATGGALMQDLSDAARTVLPSTVADSGTPLRSAIGAGTAALAGLGGAGLAGHSVPLGTAAAVAIPAAVGGGLMTLPYTSMGQKLAQALLAQRPKMAKPLADALRQAGPLLGAATAPALLE